ncbi:mandelate racemase/muconate lactonizing enzyme family protein [Maribellus maritimus]|uniref:mandelate racemase/muconate lactonizing enzyme family protein n=1 Tax=Maribellus maritimus TaxID=2870838 RepID=UPI001EEBCEF9|nr:mandelate racemase/muconate lactonizing enzyme family protein [Maribellus maritimus]MCG6187415.1 mandelate racemase/muconate lactonizing enzyme family protein [Maribellus maritimus]
MNLNRRNFLKSSSLAVVGTAVSNPSSAFQSNDKMDYSVLDKMLTKQVLKKELFPDPVIIETLELLRYEDNFICRVRSTGGAEGISVGNNMQMISLYPIFTKRLQPFFPGKDARDLEKILDEVYVYQSNYKLQSLALWVPLATIEFAILDMLGRIAGKPMGELIGEIHQIEIAVYQANNFRGKTAKESIEGIKRQVGETQSKAVKFKIGGRMSNNADYPPGRTEELIPLVRKTFGENMTIYADSNGSYTIEEAIRIGRILQEYKIDFYEEPVPFDWYEETLEVAKALTVPIAGGEQEPSMYNFRWLIAHDALQIVQPDIFYFGGMLRSMKVARMADASGKICVPHISGSGLGYLYMMHFVSAIPNAGPFHEFKGFNREIPLECKTSDLKSNEGVVKVPSGPGLGVEVDPEFIGKHKLVKG